MSGTALADWPKQVPEYLIKSGPVRAGPQLVAMRVVNHTPVESLGGKI